MIDSALSRFTHQSPASPIERSTPGLSHLIDADFGDALFGGGNGEFTEMLHEAEVDDVGDLLKVAAKCVGVTNVRQFDQVSAGRFIEGHQAVADDESESGSDAHFRRRDGDAALGNIVTRRDSVLRD